MRGRKPATGRFQTREELVAEVWDRYLNTPLNVAEIARFARVSEGVVHNIIKHKEGRPVTTPITTLNLSVRAQNCLIAEGLITVEQVADFIRQHGRNGLLRIPNLGRKWADEVLAAVPVEQAAPTIEELRQQRDDLLTTLEYILTRTNLGVIYEAAENAIAKVKGTEPCSR